MLLLVGCCRARPVPTGFQCMDRRQAVERSRMTSAQHGEDGVLLQRSVTKRAVEMATSADISTGVGAAPPPTPADDDDMVPDAGIPSRGWAPAIASLLARATIVPRSPWRT